MAASCAGCAPSDAGRDKRMKKELTASRARELLSYCHESGFLTRRITTSHKAVAGTAPGWVNAAGYIAINLDGGGYLAHRLAWLIVYGEWPKGVIDHINQNKLDNRIANLRDVTRQVNTQNSRKEKVGKLYGASLAGANWDSHAGRWKSSICVNGRHKHLGRFDTELEAHNAYISAKRKLHEGCTL